jgi:hypothetical protein
MFSIQLVQDNTNQVEHLSFLSCFLVVFQVRKVVNSCSDRSVKACLTWAKVPSYCTSTSFIGLVYQGKNIVIIEYNSLRDLAPS